MVRLLAERSGRFDWIDSVRGKKRGTRPAGSRKAMEREAATRVDRVGEIAFLALYSL